MVICSELADNPGIPVTGATENIAAEVIAAHRLLDPVWIGDWPAGLEAPKQKQRGGSCSARRCWAGLTHTPLLVVGQDPRLCGNIYFQMQYHLSEDPAHC